MTGKLLGAALILAGALGLFLACRDARCRIQTLRRELYRSLEGIAGGIRWKKERLPELAAEAARYPLAGKYYGQLTEKLKSNIPLQDAWQIAFSNIPAEKETMLAVELSGDEARVTSSLEYAAKEIRSHWETAEGQRQRELRLRLAGIFSLAGFVIILLL